LADIFLSYSRKDRAVAALLAEILPEHGWTLYWDRQLLAGEVFDDVLEREIAAARCVVVLWSSNSIASQWVRNEADEGASRSQMVSVRIEDVKLPLAFRRIQAADLIGWRGDRNDERLIELIQAIASILGGHPQPATEKLASAPSPSVRPPVVVPTWPQGPPSEQWLSGLKRDLAEYLGPVASIVVGRALRESSSSKELIEKVGGEIPNESERKQFLKSRRPADAHPADPRAEGTPLKPRAPIQASLADAEKKTPEAHSVERFGQALQNANAEVFPKASPVDGLVAASSSPLPQAGAALPVGAALHKGPDAIALRQPAAAAPQLVNPTVLIEEKHTGKASFQTPVAPAGAWSTKAKAMSIAGALVVVLGVAWMVHAFSSKQSGGPPVAPVPARSVSATAAAKTVPAPLQLEAAQSALSISPATLSLSYQANAQSYPVSQVNVTSLASPLNFSVRVTKGDDWLTIKPSAGVTPGVLSVSFHNPPSGALAAGNHIGELRCETDGGQAYLIPVNLTVRNAAPTAPLLVDSKVMDGLLVNKVVPKYPELARSARVQGPVEFAAVIGKDGSVQSLRLLGGHPLLVKAAQDAVEQFRYKPTLLKGQPVEVATHIVVSFTLKPVSP
jgi:TonB family protein